MSTLALTVGLLAHLGHIQWQLEARNELEVMITVDLQATSLPASQHAAFGLAGHMKLPRSPHGLA